jgi:hypothetical protein
MVDEKTYHAILDKLRQWERAFPNPDEPLFGAAVGWSGRMQSPRQIVSEVERKTPAGRQFIEQWVQRVGRDHILNSSLF